MTKTQGGRQSLVSRLRQETMAAESAPAATKRASVLTPAPAPRPMSKKTKTLVLYVPRESEIQLQGILEEGSPFSAPLTLTNLLDLMYCEAANSDEFLERAISQIKGMEMPIDYKKTSAILKTSIDAFFQKKFGLSSVQSLTKLLIWAVSDWQWIAPRIAYRGLKKPTQGAE